MTSDTFVLVVVVLESTPEEKFGTTGTAAAGAAMSKSIKNLT